MFVEKKILILSQTLPLHPQDFCIFYIGAHTFTFSPAAHGDTLTRADNAVPLSTISSRPLHLTADSDLAGEEPSAHSSVVFFILKPPLFPFSHFFFFLLFSAC